MSTLAFGSLGSFGAFMGRHAAESALIVPLCATAAKNIIKEKADKLYGDANRLEPLAQSTQDERAALGYAANEPLYRDGTLLKESVEEINEDGAGGIGTNEPIHLYHERGYDNVRAGVSVAPRPVFLYALEDAMPEIDAFVGQIIKAALGFEGTLTLR